MVVHQDGKNAAVAGEPYYAVLNLDRGVCVGRQIRVAGRSGERRQGLLGIAKLEEGAGLWIAPSEAIHTFGMKLPIDVVFLDAELRVRKLVPSLRPTRISICMAASSVLELDAGAIERSGTRLGDRLKFEPASGQSRNDDAQPMSYSAKCLPS